MSEPLTTKHCPKCGAEMERIEREPDVGIMVGGYVCVNEECECIIDDDFDDLVGDEEI